MTSTHPPHAFVTPDINQLCEHTSHFSEPDTHHGLVDEPSSLELDYAKGVCWVGPGVLDHAPFFLWVVDLHQLVCFLD